MAAGRVRALVTALAGRLQSSMFLQTVPFLALIVLAAVLSFTYHELLRRQRDLVEHTYRVLTVLETTTSRIVDAETGQRGFVITGDSAYLAPYARAVVEIPASLRELRGLIADNPEQLRREQALAGLLEGKMSELRDTIDARQSQGLDVARRVVLRDRGRRLMDEARSVMTQMRAAETELLQRRTASARTTERRLLAVTVACALLSLAARIGIAVVTARRR